MRLTARQLPTSAVSSLSDRNTARALFPRIVPYERISVLIWTRGRDSFGEVTAKSSTNGSIANYSPPNRHDPAENGERTNYDVCVSGESRQYLIGEDLGRLEDRTVEER